jgi:AcrR family transcriptional regulator
MSGLERREQLLDVTAEMISDGGFPVVTIKSVAARAGISRPIVYEHFGDLQGLLEALVDREMNQALAQVSESEVAELGEREPLELILESLRIYLSVVQQHPDTWRLVLMPAEGVPESLQRRIMRGRAAVLQKLTEAAGPGPAPSSRSPDPEVTARTLSAMADEYARLILTDPSAYSSDRLLAHARWFFTELIRRPG